MRADLVASIVVVASGALPEYDVDQWKGQVTGSACEATRTMTAKDGVTTSVLSCFFDATGRHFSFPEGKFDIDEQVELPEGTTIEGNADPNSASDKSQKPAEDDQTFFVATHGVTDPNAAYCGTNNNLKPGDAKKLRVGFLMNSHTRARNFNYQGRDTTRPYDNGNLCGGGVFETPGCVSPGFGDGVGTDWVSKRVGCYDHTGQPNDLILGSGKGVEDVIIENVRLNHMSLPDDPTKYVGAEGSQVAVWVAQTQDGSATKHVHVRNVVSMLSRGDGINYHGNVKDSTVEDCHVENTGDDAYAFWGGYAEDPSGVSFTNNFAKNVGVTRNYGYGVCVAIYGGRDVEFSGNKCVDRLHADWNPGQVPSGDDACQNGPYCNSCLAYVHDGWFGAVYPANNSIRLKNNSYVDFKGNAIPDTDRPKYRRDSNSKANIDSDEPAVTPSPAPQALQV